ncbi:response regulator transcription factor [Winogradskyella helgolandensis]|uniref:response regulator transcription factor n=1 Tax=Winogradskyella helgolandensis TaxID=2697010 RepID=UPI0015CAD560|nr:response regulator transcription factor [Winogradskyella helgolandensis]
MYNILIVEDEILIANLLKNYIESAGFKCCGIAIDFEEALDILGTEQTIDLVFLDVSLFGVKTGIDIANYINTKYDIPYLYLTSYNDVNTLNEITKTNPIGYLSKPFKKIDVVTALQLHFNSNKTIDVKSFKFTNGKSIYTVDLTELLYVKSEHVYSRLTFLNETLLIRQSLSSLINTFPEELLIRINKSVAINPNFINKTSGTTVEVKDEVFKLSRKFTHNLKDLDNFI